MRVTWGLNPLADVFEPKVKPADNNYMNNPSMAVPATFKVSQKHASPPSRGLGSATNTPIPASFNTTVPPLNPFPPSNPNATKQHLMATQQQHQPISSGYNLGHNNPPVMWGPGGHAPLPVPQQQPGLVQPPGLVGPQLQPAPYNIGYPPVFPPGAGPGPHVCASNLFL